MVMAKPCRNLVWIAYDERFAFGRTFSSSLQERDTDGAKQLSIGQGAIRHDNVGQTMDFIDDDIFDTCGFHVGPVFF